MRARILHVCKVAGLSGAENHLLLFLPGLSRDKYEVSFAVLTEPKRPAPEFAARLRQAGIAVEAVRIRADADPRCLLELTRLMRRGRFDLVHTHLIHGDLYGAVAARLAGVPRLVSSKHNDASFRRRLPWRLLNGWLNRRADRIIAISGSVARFTCEREGAAADRVEVIHYGLDAGRLVPAQAPTLRQECALSPEGVLFGIVARLTEQKGHRYLFEAFARLARQEPGARLVVAGDGELRAALQAQVRSLGLSSRVAFLGHRTDVANVMGDLDVFVHPSLWEGFGLVFLEAMAQGLPVIATRVSAIPEIVAHGETGLLVPARDAAALAQAMSRLAADAELCRRLGEAGRERVAREFTVEAMVARTEALYDRLLAR